MNVIRLPLRSVIFADNGMWGAQFLGRWQIDVRDHRRQRPLFSVRELGAYCGRHLGPWCLRVGRLKKARDWEIRDDDFCGWDDEQGLCVGLWHPKWVDHTYRRDDRLVLVECIRCAQIQTHRVCARCHQWEIDHPGGVISPEEQASMDAYEGGGV